MTNKIPVKNIFIYLTERCNLDCEYCYFKDKRKRTLDFAIIRKFVNLSQVINSRIFSAVEISGGEPLLVWPLLKNTIAYLKKKFPGMQIGVQTNGILLNAERIDYFLNNNILLEIGLDGDFPANRHRLGMSRTLFNRIVNNIILGTKRGLEITCTMTVHPAEVGGIRDNYMFLKSLGLKDIDITPAAFMKWKKSDIENFKRFYLRILNLNEADGLYIREDRDILTDFCLDLSLHPPGYVFCGDAFLCLPEKARKNFSLLNLHAEPSLNKKRLLFYLREYRNYFGTHRNKMTYRDYINCSFKLVNKIMDRKYLDSGKIIELHNFFKSFLINPADQ